MMNLNLDTIFSSLMNPALNEFQAWALQNPEESLSKTLLPTIALIEGVIANEPTYLQVKRLAFGANFCCAGQVVMSEFATLEKALTSPQARGWRLGTSVLDPDRAPNQDVGGRNVFLLSLSDRETDGSSNHAAFRSCMQKYLFNSATTDRQEDEIARRLLERLAADYTEMPARYGGSVFYRCQARLDGIFSPIPALRHLWDQPRRRGVDRTSHRITLHPPKPAALLRRHRQPFAKPEPVWTWRFIGL
jgi:hypothetical protein